MLECPYQPRLSAYHDGELDAATAQQLQSHLPGCAGCRDTLAGINAVATLLQSQPTGRMSQMGLARLHDTADRAARAVSVRKAVSSTIRPLAAVAASILVIGGAWLVEIPTSHPAGPTTGVQPVSRESWESVAVGKDNAVPQDIQRQTGTADAQWSRYMLRNLQGRQGQP